MSAAKVFNAPPKNMNDYREREKIRRQKRNSMKQGNSKRIESLSKNVAKLKISEENKQKLQGKNKVSNRRANYFENLLS